MTDLINGKTPEEIKAGLKHCNETVLTACAGCPYNGECIEHSPEIDAIALIEHLEAKVPRWISVEERLPENDNLVLVRANGRAREIRWDGEYVLATYGSEGWVLWDYDDDEVRHLRILQWMPLPEQPKEDE